jgi:hypothetical protein
MQEKKCKSCLCYDPKSGYCQVNILINEKKMKLPVFAEDNCHFLELGMDVEQIRMWEEGKDGEHKTIKIEYPVGFFGPEDKKPLRHQL